jgi:hypothetical protein
MFELERDGDGADLAAPADGAPEPPADLCVEAPFPCAPRQRVTFEAKVVRDAGSTNNTNNNNTNNANELDADTVLAIMVRLVAGVDEVSEMQDIERRAREVYMKVCMYCICGRT